MNEKTIRLNALPSYPFPTSLAHTASGRQVRHALIALETNLIARKQDRILLLLEQEVMKDVALLSIERLLRSTLCRRVLLLIRPKIREKMIEAWEYGVSWEDGRELTAQFAVTSAPQHAQEAQVCIATVFDIQLSVGVDPAHPFFKAFDVIILYDVPPNPGPAWCRIVDLFATRHARVIGLSSMLTEEDGRLLFEHVIDATGLPEKKLSR